MALYRVYIHQGKATSPSRGQTFRGSPQAFGIRAEEPAGTRAKQPGTRSQITPFHSLISVLSQGPQGRLAFYEASSSPSVAATRIQVEHHRMLVSPGRCAPRSTGAPPPALCGQSLWPGPHFLTTGFQSRAPPAYLWPRVAGAPRSSPEAGPPAISLAGVCLLHGTRTRSEHIFRSSAALRCLTGWRRRSFPLTLTRGATNPPPNVPTL